MEASHDESLMDCSNNPSKKDTETEATMEIDASILTKLKISDTGDKIFVGELNDQGIYMDEESIYIYLVNQRVASNLHNAERFSEVLLKNYFKSEEALYLRSTIHPVLDALLYVSRTHCKYDHFVTAVDEVLGACDLQNAKVGKEEVEEFITINKDIVKFYQDQPLAFCAKKVTEEMLQFMFRECDEVFQYINYIFSKKDGDHFAKKHNFDLFDYIRRVEEVPNLFFITIRILAIMEEFDLIKIMESFWKSFLQPNCRYEKFDVTYWRAQKKPSLSEELMHASKEGRISDVQKLLQRGCKVNLQDEEGLTALMYASKFGRWECVKELLKNQCDVNITDNNGLSALLHASRTGSWVLVQELFENQSDVNTKDDDGFTALMHASRSGKVLCVEGLLKLQCDINTEDNDGLTALMHASRLGNRDCVLVLLANHCDVNTKDKHGYTALMHASRANNGHLCVEALLKKQCEVDAKDNAGLTALMHASRVGNRYCVEVLLKKQCEINTIDNAGLTALMYASRYGTLQCVKVLLENYCDVNAKDNDGLTALMHASRNGHAECKNIIIELARNLDEDLSE